MHHFWDIRLQKCRDLENRVRVASRSLEISSCDRALMTSYWRSIVTMALSRVISEIFNVEKCRDLEIGVRGHSRSLKVIGLPFGRSCMVSYLCSLVTLSLRRTVFEIIDFKTAVTLKTGLGVRQGHWKCHQAIEHILTFYSNYGSISCRFWDIQCRTMSWLWNQGQRSLKVIESGIIQ